MATTIAMPDKLAAMQREDFPELWGPSEIVEFARTALQDADPRADISERSITRWLSLPDFPAPVATLRMGPVFIAEDVKPWVIDRLSISRIRPGRVGNAIPDETRKEVAAAYGRMTQAQAAATYGVSLSTVYKIWKERRRSESQS